MPLYFMSASDVNGECMDFFVRAESVDEAADLYRDMVDTEEFDEIAGDIRCYTVPLFHAPSQVIDWTEVECAMVTP